MATTHDLFAVGACNCPASGPPAFKNCCLCSIPEETLALSWTNSISGSGSGSLTWNSGASNWTMACVSNAQPFYLTATLSCATGVTSLAIVSHTGAGCTGTPTTCTLTSSTFLASFTCNPYSMTFNVTSGGCPTLYALGFRTFTISDPNAAPICNCAFIIGNNTLFITDSLGTWSCPKFFSVWQSALITTGTVSPVENNCIAGSSGSTTCYYYQINCAASATTGNLTLTVARAWPQCYCTSTPHLRYGTNCASISSLSCNVGSGCGTSGSGSVDISGTPFSASGSLTYPSTIVCNNGIHVAPLPDPVGNAMFTVSN